MKTKKWLTAILVVFGLCAVTVLALYLKVRNGPPSDLANSGYYIHPNKVYFHPGFGLASPFEIIGADPATFTDLDGSYALDANHVYLDGVRMDEADPATFELVTGSFTRDAYHVFLGLDVFSDDPAHFENVEGNIFRDSEHIYWSATIISDDPAHLIILGSSGFYTYLRDSTTVFIQGNLLQDADPVTFAIIEDAYSRDAAHIFYFDQSLPEADSATFEIIASPYARDATHVYFMERILADADPSTFVVLNVKFQCSADATHAYYMGDLIPGFDPASIPPGVNVTNCDANGIYFSQ